MLPLKDAAGTEGSTQVCLLLRTQIGAEKIVQLVKCLLYKHEDLSLTCRTHLKKKKNQKQKTLGIVVSTYNPSLGKPRDVEPGGSLGLAGQPAKPTWQVTDY